MTRVSTSRDPLILPYKCKGNELQAETTSKYFGNDLSNDMYCKPHIDRIVKKFNSMVGFLRRNLRISSQETKSMAYMAMVRSHLEYCAKVCNHTKGTHPQVGNGPKTCFTICNKPIPYYKPHLRHARHM